MGMRFGTWNVRSLFRAGSLKTAASELAKYKLDLVAVQVTWDKQWQSASTNDYTFFSGNGNVNHCPEPDLMYSSKSDWHLRG